MNSLGRVWCGSVWIFKLLSRAKVDLGQVDLLDPKSTLQWHANGRQERFLIKKFFKKVRSGKSHL